MANICHYWIPTIWTFKPIINFNSEKHLLPYNFLYTRLCIFINYILQIKHDVSNITPYICTITGNIAISTNVSFINKKLSLLVQNKSDTHSVLKKIIKWNNSENTIHS